MDLRPDLPIDIAFNYSKVIVPIQSIHHAMDILRYSRSSPNRRPDISTGGTRLDARDALLPLKWAELCC